MPLLPLPNHIVAFLGLEVIVDSLACGAENQRLVLRGEDCFIRNDLRLLLLLLCLLTEELFILVILLNLLELFVGVQQTRADDGLLLRRMRLPAHRDLVNLFLAGLHRRG